MAPLRKNNGGLNFSNKGSGLSFGPSQDRRQQGKMSRKGAYVQQSSLTTDKGRPAVSGKGKALIALLIVGSLVLAFAVGVIVYQMTVRNALKIDLDDAALETVLGDAEADDAGYWGVLARTDSDSAEIGHGNLIDIALVRVNTEKQNISLLWIPVDTRVYLDGYGYRTVSEAFDLEAGKSAVAAAESLADVSVRHYMEVNSAGLGRLLGDLNIGDVDANSSTAMQLAKALFTDFLGTSSEQIPSVASSITMCVSTDMPESDLTTFLNTFQGVNASSVYQEQAPTSEATENGNSYIAITQDSWKSMVIRAGNGQSPVASSKELSNYEHMRNGVSVAIWNGVGVSGIAADCSDELKRLGWSVGDTGNAAQFVYDETLIVYRDTNDEELADLLASDLGQGRVVRSGARYSFTGDLLVVVGKNYQPY